MPCTTSSSSSLPRWSTPDEVATPTDVWLHHQPKWRCRRSCRDPTHISSLVTEGPAFHTPSHVKQRHISSLVNGDLRSPYPSQ
jgi:hypothetical protein